MVGFLPTGAPTPTLFRAPFWRNPIKLSSNEYLLTSRDIESVVFDRIQP
jgi:hypothetical protein